MAKINFKIDPTLAALKAAQEEGQYLEPRNYLGMSYVGKECSRALWYSFRWALTIKFAADVLRRFEDGHIGEEIMAKRLRAINGLELHTVNAKTGKQFAMQDCGGHFAGHMDGAIRGLLHDPKTWYVWEHKQVDQKKFDLLNKAKDKLGEENALKDWDSVYYAQAQLYMHYSKIKLHYLTCALPGGRDITSTITEYNREDALFHINKGKAAIKSGMPPARFSANESVPPCLWCDYKSICHGKALPKVSCRTCVHATPVIVDESKDAKWHCSFHDKEITTDEQRNGCDSHVYIPDLLQNLAEHVDANPDENWIEYETKNGTKFKNGKGFFSSHEIRAGAEEGLDAFSDEELTEMKKIFGAKVS